MIGWECAIDDCGAQFATAEVLIDHQRADHAGHECRVCETVVPDGYLAIRHAFEEHTRAEYVRAYEADAEAIRTREAVLRTVEEVVDEPPAPAGEAE